MSASEVIEKIREKLAVLPINSAFDNAKYNFDSLVIVSPDLSKLNLNKSSFLNGFVDILKHYREFDAAFDDTVTFLVPNVQNYEAIKKLVYSPTGPLDRHIDDVRRFQDATDIGIKRALQAGSKRILLAVLNYQSHDTRNVYDLFDKTSLLAAFHSLYVPLEVREDIPSKAEKAEVLGFCSTTADYQFITAIEQGRIVARDIGGSDPERMAAPSIANYIRSLFPSNSAIKINIINDDNVFKKEYPLLCAVNRAAKGVDRHKGRVVFLTYDSNDQPSKTVFLVGKGITYDTGGADIKAGGHMAGMHRDKCGAAAVAGFFQTLDKLRPKNIKVVGAMAFIRNSVGSDAYVADEIITSRAGVRVRVGNTDAEGRMVMADLLCHVKEMALQEVNPYLFTVATLTGHARLAMGLGYSIIADNGPAEMESVSRGIQLSGMRIGDTFEISTIRREDYNFCKGPSEYEDILQCNNAASTQTPRGHQFPAAFLILASGLDKHDINSTRPLKYSHIDIAPSSGPFPGVPTGAPIPALTYYFCQ